MRDPDRQAVERFCRELAPLVTSGPPGIAGYATGRPAPRPAFGYWPALVPRSLVEAKSAVRTAGRVEQARDRAAGRSLINAGEGCRMVETHSTIRLGDLAHARSGDKGDRANIGVVANDDACFRLACDRT